MQLKTLLSKKGMKTEAIPFYEKYVKYWEQLYTGYIPGFHEYKIATLKGFESRKRKSLKMAKTVSEEWADILFDEQVRIAIDNTSTQEFIDGIMDDIFYVTFAERLEKAFGLGSGLLIEYIDATGNAAIKMLDADAFLPVKWTREEVTGVAEFTSYEKGKEKYILITFHTAENGKYKIEQELWFMKSQGNYSRRVSLQTLPETAGLQDELLLDMEPAFQIIKPYNANNTEFKAPFGISVYNTADDILQSLDERYDEYNSEFDLGRRRVIVSNDALRADVDTETGQMVKYFDPKDILYTGFALEGEDLIKPIDFPLRGKEYIESIQADLELLAAKTGFSSGKFTFGATGVKTATEVISANSKTFKKKVKHEIILGGALIKMVKALVKLNNGATKNAKVPEEYGIEIHFNDSLIVDDDKKREEERKDVLAGNMPVEEYLKRNYKLNDEEVKQWLKQIDKRKATVNNINFMGLTDPSAAQITEPGGGEE